MVNVLVDVARNGASRGHHASLRCRDKIARRAIRWMTGAESSDASFMTQFLVLLFSFRKSDSARVTRAHPSKQAATALLSEGGSDGISVRREGSHTLYEQRAIFHPHGLLGHLYWWSISPMHSLIFGRMPGNITHTAEAQESPENVTTPVAGRRRRSRVREVPPRATRR